jgi:pyruvate dehydrogenase E2 component (dihydrolipoamide acetyltransferase)
MPSLGADMDTGTIVEWRVAPGTEVKRGDIVAVVATDKADIDVEVFESGYIESLLVPVGVKVAVGTALAMISAAPAAGVAAAPAAAPGVLSDVSADPAAGSGVLSGVSAPAAAAYAAAPACGTPATPAPSTGGPSAPAALSGVLPRPRSVVPASGVPGGGERGGTHSPLVRRLAARLGVDLASVVGTGKGGAVTRRDVEAAAGRLPVHRTRVSPRARRLAREQGVALDGLEGTGPGGAVVGDDVVRARAPSPEAPAPAAAVPSPEVAPTPALPTKEEKALAMRRAIGNLMARSKREIPHYTVAVDIDCSVPLAWLAAENERRPVAQRLLPAAVLLKAAALAAAEVPGMNGWWQDDQYVPGDGVQLGVAVSLRTGGLIAPAIRDAHTCTLDEVMAGLKDLVTRARSGHLKASELTGATITVTNLGDQGADSVAGVIYPPQVALVGFGRIRERPWAEGGMLAVRPVVTVTLAADHRASDGLQGARFLDAVARHLHTPEAL